MPPRTTLWPLEPHTGAKHQLLRAYLKAWFPILGQTYGRVIFVDGFAGPGQYADGEPGSPLVALEVADTHQERLAKGRAAFLFIEEDRERHRHLDDLISNRKTPDNVSCSVIHGAFADVVGTVLDSIGDKQLAPAFVMIDPFGPKGVPYEIIKRLASYKRTELLVSFMYESVARFLATQEYEQHLDKLFGCREWRKAIDLADPSQKRSCLHDLFKTQLEAAGMKFVRSFEMIDSGGRTEYFLFFATHNLKGIEVMKNAMWSVDRSGNYRFSDMTRQDQPVLFEVAPDFTTLRKQVANKFRGEEVSPWQIEGFVTAETPFRKEHLRKGVLIPLEEEGSIEVTGRKRNRTYPKACRIKFK